jgi:hypothetical protein
MPFLELIKRGEALIDLTEEDSNVTQWKKDCVNVIRTFFEILGKGLPIEGANFQRADFPSGKMEVLRAIQYKALERSNKTPFLSVNQVVTQNQTIHNDISIQLHLSIEYAELNDEEKAEAKNLVNEISTEVQKPDTNWKRVTNMLRESFDYGLKVALDISKLVDFYLHAKGGK